MQCSLPAGVAMLYSMFTLLTSSYAADFDFGFELGNSDNSGGFGGGGGGGFFFDTFPGNCGIGGQAGSMCRLGGTFSGFERADADTTPFYQGEAYIDGQWYWHVIVGDPDAGFAMESYTRRALGTSFGSFSGGEPANFSGLGLKDNSGSGWDPLGMNASGRGVDFTGNGSGDPTRTVIRQVMGNGTWDAQSRTWNCDSGEYCSEFLKDRLDSKPIISQTINDSTTGPLMQAQFQLDMSNLTYSDDTTAGAIINTLTLTDPSDSEFFRVNGNFYMATDTEAGKSVVTAGRYVYNTCSNPDFEGSCWQAFSISGLPNIYKEGSYTYVDGGTDPMTYNWGAFFDPIQNTFSGGGSGSGNQDKCTKAGGIRPDTCNPLF